MLFSGVRSSWLMVVMKRLLARLACSATWRAVCNSPSVTSWAWISSRNSSAWRFDSSCATRRLSEVSSNQHEPMASTSNTSAQQILIHIRCQMAGERGRRARDVVPASCQPGHQRRTAERHGETDAGTEGLRQGSEHADESAQCQHGAQAHRHEADGIDVVQVRAPELDARGAQAQG